MKAAVLEVLESGVDCEGDLPERVPEDIVPLRPEERQSERMELQEKW